MRRIRISSVLPMVLVPVGAGWAATPPAIVTGGVPVGLEPITSVSGPPLALDFAPDGSDRLFIAGQSNGQVRLFKNNALQATPFLDVTTAGVTLFSSSESGLLGIAFHPNFAAAPGTPGRGKFYTFTSEPKGANTTGVDFIHPELVATNAGDHDNVVREWTVSSSNPDVIDTTIASRPLLRLRKPQQNHNAGELRFGPDGYLYLTTGDGGQANDFSGTASSTTDGHTNDVGNAQDKTGIYGKMIRIDPLLPTDNPTSTDPESTNHKYRNPQSNPFVGAAGLDEIYAYGLRNPWRFSFDRTAGTLYAGDVGQSAREEVDIIVKADPANSTTGNYGWVFREGTANNAGSGRTTPVGFTSTDPIAEYTHTDGQAIIGGYVYRGSNIPELYGKYFFGELGVGSPSHGRLFYMSAAGGTINEVTYSFNAPTSQLYSFGEDKDGELFAMFANGTVARLLGRQWLTNGGGSWNTASNWLAGAPNAAGASANFLGRLSTPSTGTVALDGNKTVGALRFNNPSHSYVITPGSGGSLTLDNGASAGLIQVIRGTHTVAVPVTVAGDADLDVAAGSGITLSSALNISASKTLTKKGAGSASATGGVGLGASSVLSVTQGNFTTTSITGGSLNVSGGALTTLLASSSLSRLSDVSVTSAKLDVTNNEMILTSANAGSCTGSIYNGIAGLVQSGRNGGTWNGNGIITSQSSALSPNLPRTTLGVARASQARPSTATATALWNGQTITGTDTLVMYTYAGDATLDGNLDIDDYARIDTNVALAPVARKLFWANGDFNYDGLIDVDDYSLIDDNIVLQPPPPGFGGGGGGGFVPVPEPSSAFVLTLFMASRRRRRREPQMNADERRSEKI